MASRNDDAATARNDQSKSPFDDIEFHESCGFLARDATNSSILAPQ